MCNQNVRKKRTKFNKNLNDCLLELLISYQVENSKNLIGLIEQNIQLYEFMLKNLIKIKPYRFQRRKLKIWEEQTKIVSNCLFKNYCEIEQELFIIEDFYNKTNEFQEKK